MCAGSTIKGLRGCDGTGLRTDLNHRTNVARPVGMQSDTLNQQKYQTCADLAKAYQSQLLWPHCEQLELSSLHDTSSPDARDVTCW